MLLLFKKSYLGVIKTFWRIIIITESVSDLLLIFKLISQYKSIKYVSTFYSSHSWNFQNKKNIQDNLKNICV